MTEELKLKLQNLAEKYETASFCNDDPSFFLRWYEKYQMENKDDFVKNTECAAFIAAMLAFGKRSQFIPKIQEILELCCENDGGKITDWCLNGAKNFPFGDKKFYRFYSYNDLHIFFDEIAEILREAGSLGERIRTLYVQNPEIPLHELVSKSFPKSKIVPKGKNSANKRVNMFLRWMVRKNSPVDLGLWTWANPQKLIIPLDVHVLQESIKLGLLPETAPANLKTAEKLTEQLKEVFPDDPVKGDFALFGIGIANV